MTAPLSSASVSNVFFSRAVCKLKSGEARDGRAAPPRPSRGSAARPGQPVPPADAHSGDVPIPDSSPDGHLADTQRLCSLANWNERRWKSAPHRFYFNGEARNVCTERSEFGRQRRPEAVFDIRPAVEGPRHRGAPGRKRSQRGIVLTRAVETSIFISAPTPSALSAL